MGSPRYGGARTLFAREFEPEQRERGDHGERGDHDPGHEPRAAAPAQTTITGASTAARESEISKAQVTASTSAEMTNPDAIAAFVLMRSV